MIHLYRADGGRASGGLSSWTSAREHAEEYLSGRFDGLGGRTLVELDVDEAGSDVLDIRTDPAKVLRDRDLVDLEDYDGTLQDVLRDLAALFRAHGVRWVRFRERPERHYDEWLLIDGAVP